VRSLGSGETPEREGLYPHPTRELAERRSRLASEPAAAFRAFSKSVFAEGALRPMAIAHDADDDMNGGSEG
jgi:hypothetical protein